jgi:hypothetical protein
MVQFAAARSCYRRKHFLTSTQRQPPSGRTVLTGPTDSVEEGWQVVDKVSSAILMATQYADRKKEERTWHRVHLATNGAMLKVIGGSLEAVRRHGW